MDEIEVHYNGKSKIYNSEFDSLFFKVYDSVTWKYLEPYIPTKPEAMVLDAGGGTGRWSIQMAKKGCKVFLVDISQGMLEVAKENIKKEEVQDRIVIQKGDITKLDYPNQTFDLVLCEHVMFLFPNPELVVNEMVRVLKRNGLLIISAGNFYVAALKDIPDKIDEVINLLSEQSHISLKRKQAKVIVKTGPKVHLITPNEFRELLERNGLKIAKIIGKGITMPLRIPSKTYTKKKYSKEQLKKILQIEFALCEKTDALGLAGHLHAVAYKT